jgi:RNA-dependent RNA polymerase
VLQKVHADSSPLGVKDPACIRLAGLHSMAVDFNKTGVPAEMPAELRVRNFPDFMGKRNDATYVSTKVLGELYRRVHLEKRLLLIDSPERIELNEALLVPGYEQFVDEAQETKQRYDLELTEIMNQHSVQTEAEVNACFSSDRIRLMMSECALILSMNV